MKIDLFGGTGFVGSNFKRLYNESTHVHDREDNTPIYENVLYMISTTHNYHVFDNIHKDVETNLTKLKTIFLSLQFCKTFSNFVRFVSYMVMLNYQQKKTVVVNQRDFTALPNDVLKT